MDVRTCILLFSSMTLKSNEFFIFMMVKVEQLIEKARREHTGSSRQPDKPLIRLRVGFAFMWVKFSTDKTHFFILFLKFSCSSLLENFFLVVDRLITVMGLQLLTFEDLDNSLLKEWQTQRTFYCSSGKKNHLKLQQVHSTESFVTSLQSVTCVQLMFIMLLRDEWV